MSTARPKEDRNDPGMFDGREDNSRKDFSRRGKAPGGSCGKTGFRKYRKSKRR
jgi:hypothetical protein